MTNDLQAIVLLNTAIKIGTEIRVFIKGMKKCLFFVFFFLILTWKMLPVRNHGIYTLSETCKTNGNFKTFRDA